MLLGGVFFFGHWCLTKLERSFSYAVRRFVSLILTTTVGVLVVYLFLTHTLYFKFAVAIYYFLSAVCFCCLLAGLSPVSYLYKMHDYVVGHFIFLLIGILSLFQVLSTYTHHAHHILPSKNNFLLLIFEQLSHQSSDDPLIITFHIPPLLAFDAFFPTPPPSLPIYRLVICKRGYCITTHCRLVL